jgi:hypothetical protein
MPMEAVNAGSERATSEPLLWIYEFAFGCHHGRLRNVFTIQKRTYHVPGVRAEVAVFMGTDALRSIRGCG